MNTTDSDSQPGVEMLDLASNLEFSRRPTRVRDASLQVVALRRLAQIFANDPDEVLQELVEIATDLCGADSAGISLEDPSDPVFRWVALSGRFRRYMNGTAPRFYSPCGTCLDRGAPQVFRVTQSYYDALGITAEPVTDGILIPWQSLKSRGTIWVVAHEAAHAFDMEDYRMMQNLADFAAIAMRKQYDHELIVKNATLAASAVVANELAHRINDPLQSLTHAVNLLAKGGMNSRGVAQQASDDLDELSDLAQRLMSIRNPDVI